MRQDDDASIREGDTEITLATGTTPSQPTWDRAGDRLVVASVDGRLPAVDVFDGTTGDLIGHTLAARPYFFFSWSHDGERIAALGPGALGTTLDILDADGALLHEDVVESDSVFVAWEPGADRLIAHAGDTLARVDPDGSVVDLGVVGTDFYAPKWIPGSDEILLVVELEGTPTLVRRGVRRGDPLTSLGSVDGPTGIAVDPTGTVAALTALRLDADPNRRRTGAGETHGIQDLTGVVERLDLATAERTVVVEGLATWTEWNDDGSRLLVGTSGRDGGPDTWWVVEDGLTFAVVEYSPTGSFEASYLAFGDQYIEQPRLWSPDGDAFVYPAMGPDGGEIRVASAVEAAETAWIGSGEVGFWSPGS